MAAYKSTKIFQYRKEVPQHGIMDMVTMNTLGMEGWENYAVENGVFYFKMEIVEVVPEKKEIPKAPGNKNAKPAKKSTK